MREKTIEKQIKDYLFSIGAYFFKVHGSALMPKGIPDIVCCYKGYFIGIEVKAPGKLYNQSDEQKINMNNILKSGGIHILADNLKIVKDTIEKLFHVKHIAKLTSYGAYLDCDFETAHYPDDTIHIVGRLADYVYNLENKNE